jgi:hypothetical protein
MICSQVNILFCDFLVYPANVATPYMALKQSLCSLSIGKIFFVQMSGEQGTYIRDERLINEIAINDQYQTATLYENTVYRLNVQLECGRQSACDLSQNIKVWIDFNDDGHDGAESRIFPHSRSNNYKSDGVYDLEINIPYIDNSNTRAGPHRMRLTVTPSEEYQRDCGYAASPETRDYTVNIIPKAAYAYAGKCLTLHIEEIFFTHIALFHHFKNRLPIQSAHN